MDRRCTCGKVRYRLTNTPLFVHCCHCRWCQRETGAAFALNALIETHYVEILSGAPVAMPIPSESGKGQIIHRCPGCQIALWSQYAGAGPKFSFVRVGTLDNPDACPPDIHIYTQSKQPWVVLNPAIPAMSQYYRRSQYWPEANLKRREEALSAD